MSLIILNFLLNLKKDNETVDIVTEVVRTRQRDDHLIDHRKSNELDSIKTSNIVMDSMRVYLDNVSNAMIKSVVGPTTTTTSGHAAAAVDSLSSAGSEQEDETSIQEMITIKERKNGQLGGHFFKRSFFSLFFLHYFLLYFWLL
jgi:hypothetical protein